MHSIKLEILRHGPPNNQLLSPLTRYLATSGDHAASTLTVPFEHAEILRRLDELRRTGPNDDARRQAGLDELAARMGEVLGQIRGLISDLCTCDGDGVRIAHLRLVLSAHELALLPFEIATSGSGMPGEGQALCLQTALPLCITREVRRPQTQNLQWPRRPRILFVVASPPSLPPVPREAHLLALREAVEPWVHVATSPTDVAASILESPATLVKPHLDILLDASVDRIAARMAEGDYTHVHILAHGGELPRGRDRHFGLALHDQLDPSQVDVCDGARLAAALCRAKPARPEALSMPTVVTLATCDSGNVGSVITSSASLAHELHRAGIQLVVASQFPLSYVGSVQLTRLLYPPLLRGADPRLVLQDVRTQLRATVPQYHDWAGVVFYATFPQDLDAQLLDVRFARAKQAIQAAMNRLDVLSWRHHTAVDASTVPDSVWRAAEQRFEHARDLLLALDHEADDLVSAIQGLLASAEKRVADGFHRRSALDADQWERHVARAAEHYAKCFARDRGSAWALVQQIALDGLNHQGGAFTSGPARKDALHLARLLSEQDLGAIGDRRVWALNNLIELEVLTAKSQKSPRLLDLCGQLREFRVSHALDIQSLRHQMWRYVDGYLRVRERGGWARSVIDALPT